MFSGFAELSYIDIVFLWEDTNPGISVKIFSPQLSLAAEKTKATSQISLVSYTL